MPAIKLHPFVLIEENELSWSFARSSGPGGQHVNKTSSKALLEWCYEKSSIDPRLKQKLRDRTPPCHRITDGIKVSSDEFRSQRRNMDACLKKLKNIVASALFENKKRKKTKPTRASKERRISDKKRKSDRKAQRRVKFND
jgi:ribosome-associated protein